MVYHPAIAAGLTLLCLLILAVQLQPVTSGTTGGLESTDSLFSRAVSADFGSGYKRPKVCYGSGYFLVVWYDNNINVTAVNSTTGSTTGQIYTITTDVDIYRRPAIAYAPGYHMFLIVWRLDSNGSLYGQFLNDTGYPLNSPFQINGSSVGVGLTDFGVAYSEVAQKFVVVWSSGGYRSYMRAISPGYPPLWVP